MCSTEKKKDNSISGGLAIYQVLIYHIWYSKEQLSPFPGGSAGKESASIAGDQGLIPGWGRSPGEGNGNPLVFLPGESHGQRSLEGNSPWGHKRVGHDLVNKPP